MQGVLHIIDQAGVGLLQLQQENEVLRQRVAELEAALGVVESPASGT